MQRELSLTTVYVTHDQSEALALSHEIAVMNEGRIVQIGTPRQIYEQPKNQFVADFVGTTNFIGGTVTALDDGNGRCVVRSALGNLTAHAGDGVAKDAPVIVSVRPEDVELSEAAAGRRRRRDGLQGNRHGQGFPRRLPGFSRPGRRCRAAGEGSPVAAHADRRAIFLRMKADKCIAIPSDLAARRAEYCRNSSRLCQLWLSSPRKRRSSHAVSE